MYGVVIATLVYQSIVHGLDVRETYCILATLKRDCGRVHRVVSYRLFFGVFVFWVVVIDDGKGGDTQRE